MITELIVVSCLYSCSFVLESIQVPDSIVESSGANFKEIKKAAGILVKEEQRYFLWMLEHMPKEDLEKLSSDFLVSHLRQALKTWKESSWHEQVPESVFLNSILPYANVNERREMWRIDFYNRFFPLVKDVKSISRAAAILNNKIFKQVKVHYSTKRPKADQSPYESIEAGMASCTGLSILLIDACRSVGIPARFVGTPLWSDGSGNHSWVEVWDSGWHFTGAAEPTGMDLNKAWFTGRASRAIRDSKNAIYAVTWEKSSEVFPMSWKPDDRTVRAVDVTDRYARVQEEDKSVKKALVRFRALNENDDRIEVPIKIVSLDSGTTIDIEGITKGESFDSNDHFEAEIPLGVRCKAIFDNGYGEIDFHSENLKLISVKLKQVLTKEECSLALDNRWKEEVIRIHKEDKEEFESRKLIYKNGESVLEMPFWFAVYGEKPDAGYPIFISMHGGGGAPKEVNDRQWENQKKLYKPSIGIYCCPRGPTDTWNLWHQGHIDYFYDRLIRMLVAFENGDSERVYLMGYSAGGDGVYQLAPRMADRFAAAAMMAGHPNETKPDGLRNLPFTLHMGSEDSAYGRNRIAKEWEDALKNLNIEDPDGYVHSVHIHSEKGHWMDREDQIAVPWMEKYVRTARPSKVVWLQDDVTHKRLYWLSVQDPKPREKIVVRQEGQVFYVVEAPSGQIITIRLDDLMVDLDQEVRVVDDRSLKGTVIFQGIPFRSWQVIKKTMGERGNRFDVYTSEITVELSNKDI